MNAADLRYRVTQYLNGLSLPAEIEKAELVSGEPGEPLATVVTVRDPYTPGEPDRLFMIEFKEIG